MDAHHNIIKSVLDSFIRWRCFSCALATGVALAPFHDLDGMVPAEVKAKIEQLKADIISGNGLGGSEQQNRLEKNYNP